MPKIIKDAAISEDNWNVLALNDEALSASDVSANDVAPLTLWKDAKSNINSAELGVLLDSSDALDDLLDHLNQLPIIAINFPLFTDGRGYSLARRLRTRYHYTGDIRAVGDVLLDQLFYMRRCGFSSFSLRDEDQYSNALNYLSTINESYQASGDSRDSILEKRLKA
ncbi:MAG: DUF934 domain-containing protein [Pseudomonadota bacterium]